MERARLGVVGQPPTASRPSWVVVSALAGVAALGVGLASQYGDSSSASPNSGDSAHSAESSTDSAPRAASPSCSFAPGDRLAYDIEGQVKSDSSLSLSSAVPGFEITSSATGYKIKARLELRVLTVSETDESVLAARIQDVAGQGLGAEEKRSIQGLALVKLAPSCRIIDFARASEADLTQAQSQQRFLVSLQWQRPPGDVATSLPEFSALGEYQARYLTVGGSAGATVVRRIQRIDKVYGAGAGRGISASVSGPGLEVRTSGSAWFDRLSIDRRVIIRSSGQIVASSAERLTAVSRPPGSAADEALNIDPQRGWIWGHLLARSIPRTGQPSVAAADFSMKAVSLKDALAEFAVLLGPGYKNYAAVNFMRDWIRSHPDQVGQLIHALRSGSLPDDGGGSGLLLALELAQTSAARAALYEVMDDPKMLAIDRIRAASALASQHEVPDDLVAKLTALTRLDPESLEGTERQLAANAAGILGQIVAEQADRSPAVAQQARDELRSLLASELTPEQHIGALRGASNTHEAAFASAMVAAAGSSHRDVRLAAAFAVSNMPPGTLTDRYASWLDSEKEPEVRARLVRSMHVQHHTTGAPPQNVISKSVSALAKETDKDVIRELVSLLGLASRKGDAAAKVALQGFFKQAMAAEPRDVELLQMLGPYI